MVEFALVLPIFLLILMLLVDFGRVIYAQHTINQNAAEAARVGAVSADTLADNAAIIQRYADIRAAAKRVAPAVPMTDASIRGGVRDNGSPLSCIDVDTVNFATTELPDDPIVTGPDEACFYPNGIANSHQNGSNVFDRPPRVVVNIYVTVSIITPVISHIIGGEIDLHAESSQLLQ